MNLVVWFKRHIAHSESLAIMSTLLIAALIYHIAGAMLTPFIIGAVISYLLHFPIAWLRNYMSHFWATTVVFSLSMIVFIASCVWGIPLISLQLFHFMSETPKMSQEFATAVLAILDQYPHFFSHDMREAFVVQASFQQNTQQLLQFGSTWLLKIMPSALTVVIYLVMIPMIVFFMNKDEDYFLGLIRKAYPQSCPQLVVIWQNIKQELEFFVSAKLVHMLIIWALSLALFLSFSLKYAYILSIPMAFTVFIPYVGTAVATLPLLMIAYLQFGFGMSFLLLMSGHTLLQIIEANFIVPLLFAHSNDMHPVIILAAVLFFGQWYGVAGMFFAIPAASVIKVLIQHWPQERGNTIH